MNGAAQLRAQAASCRALARRATDGQVAANLRSLAEEYESEAERLDPAPPPPLPGPVPE